MSRLGPRLCCYVCGSDALAEGHDPRNPVCEQHLGARDHVISMRTNEAVCSCGFEILISHRQPAARDQACRDHWKRVCAGGVA